MKAKGFTLIELLIVISILAILATAVTLILNPAELLKRGRDSTRFSDLSVIHGAITLYIASAPNPSFNGNTFCTATTTPPGGPPQDCTLNATTTVDSDGWVDINFGDIPGGSPLPRLPLDPINNETYYYAFSSNVSNLTFELNAKLESEKFTITQDLDGKDGGNNSNWYEIGTEPGLDLTGLD